jgi:hypothetical protein
MKLNQIQVCLDCEECYVGDFCPKCGSGAYFYLRKYFPPMRKFGGHYEPVQVHINPVQERVQRIRNSWSKTCPMCHMQTMQIVRPGKVQCSICG